METTIFQHLTKSQIEQLVHLIQKIVQAFSPIKIICYGYRTTTISDWSCFSFGDARVIPTFPTYDLMIVIKDDEKRQHHEIIEIAEQFAIPHNCNISIIVQQLNTVNKGLEHGKRFISTVYNNGITLYNYGSALSIPRQEMEIAMLKKLIEDHWQNYFGMANCFLMTANYCFENGWKKQTVFDLHQSVEHACIAILRVCTGYRPTTHNLSRLLNLICNFSQELMVIFPRTTKEEIDLFNILNRAYSEARYNEKYSVSEDVVKIIMGRVTTLLGLIEKLYERKCTSLRSILPVSFPLNIESQ
ncbi:HEPN domain-containing protein [Chitinophaga sancti]|uniref:HEPN domain-containing protein n=1 Tax=Chitinophaga sancti TaxID=1004 RepID=UPI002A749AA1|nr:HEPN domain-containing protein [Chitinophaga sancti]WPQ63799.1 HEPN domain-containing protein [Chitinophaga sancti]